MVGGDGRPRREAWAVFFGWLRLLLEEEGKMKRRGEEKKGGVYIRGEKIIIILPSIPKQRDAQINLRLHLPNLRLGQREPNAEIKAASSRKRESRVRQKRQESMGVLI